MSGEVMTHGVLHRLGSYLGWHSHENKYEICVKTRDVTGTGTNNAAYCAFITKEGRRTKDILLDNICKNNLTKGAEETFQFCATDDLGDIERMEVWTEKYTHLDDEWFCEFILVTHINNDERGTTYPFPCHRWISPNKRYEFCVYDFSLPQFEISEKRKQQRREEIAEHKVSFKYNEESNGLPRLIDKLPERENFSSDYRCDIVTRKLKLTVEKKIQEFFVSGNWEDIEDMKPLYKRTFNLPNGWHNWKSDFKFGDQRLNGINPSQLRRCDEIPSNFPVTDEMVSEFLDCQTLEEVIRQKRLFIVDLKVLEGIPTLNGAQLCSPLALFYANKVGELLPIAIQLFQQPSADNPVFLPSDPEHKWLLVKMFFNNADCSVHQSATHLGFTHLVCESLAVAATQSMSPSHPVYQLLAPHFLYLFAINNRAIGLLLSPGEWIDTTMTMGVIGLKEIVRRKWKDWRMDREGWFPNDIKARGVDDKDVLSSFYSRDDMLLLHQAVLDYVTDVLSNVYDCQEKLIEDWEVQEFAKLLVDKDAAGIQGVFGNGQFEDLNDLIKVATSTIFISSVMHAAANFGQYDEYGFPPVYPACLFGDVPKDKEPIDEKDIISYLPNKETTLSIMVVTHLLSQRATQRLGFFEIDYLYEPEAVEGVKRFQDNLNMIGETIDERNKQVKNPYLYLHPNEIPNAISI